MSSLPLSRTANATSCCGGSRHRPGRAVPISSVATSSSNIHGRSSARVHLYRNSRVARYLQARRMKVAIGLYFILCVTLSALLFTWTIMSTVDQQQQLQQRSNNNLRLGIASNSKSSTAMKLLQRFKRGRQNNQKILGSLGEENASASTQPQQELLQPSLQERRAAEALRIPDDEPVVQVIITRFMQHQPDLLELGQARLQLLKTLCLPTLQQQTSQNFLWIIRADPQLAEPLKKELLSLIDTATQSNPYFRVVVMATNENPVGFRKPLTETPDQIWTHNYYLLQHYQQAAQTRAVLETRLDADDGLHIAFVEVMQQEAREQLVDSESMMSSNSHSKAKSQGGSKQEDSQKQHTKQSKNWLMWCSGTHVEWQYGAPWEFLAGENSNVTKKQLQDAEDSMDSTLGSLMPGLTKGCITPGLTTGYGKYVNFDDVPNAQHHMLHRKVRPCHDPTEQQHEHNNKRCLIFWKEVIPAAIRGRTPTSAGMQFVLGKHMSSLSPQARQALGADEPELLREKQSMMWESVERRFDISKDSVRQMRNFLTDHMHGIVQDNYEGQCTQGHSCKNSSRIILKQLMEESVEPAAAGSNNNNNSTTTTTATSR